MKSVRLLQQRQQQNRQQDFLCARAVHLIRSLALSLSLSHTLALSLTLSQVIWTSTHSHICFIGPHYFDSIRAGLNQVEFLKLRKSRRNSLFLRFDC